MSLLFEEILSLMYCEAINPLSPLPYFVICFVFHINNKTIISYRLNYPHLLKEGEGDDFPSGSVVVDIVLITAPKNTAKK